MFYSKSKKPQIMQPIFTKNFILISMPILTNSLGALISDWIEKKAIDFEPGHSTRGVFHLLSCHLLHVLITSGTSKLSLELTNPNWRFLSIRNLLIAKAIMAFLSGKNVAMSAHQILTFKSIDHFYSYWCLSGQTHRQRYATRS